MSYYRQSSSERIYQTHERRNDYRHKLTLESRFIDVDKYNTDLHSCDSKKKGKMKTNSCVCEICKRYYELFHSRKYV